MPRRPGRTRDTGGGGLTHVDSAGHAHMVDVTAKPWTDRRALARCRVAPGTAGPAWVDRARPDPSDPSLAWTELFATARLAGIQAAKQTPRLIPLCHPLSVAEVEVRLALASDGVDIEGTARVVGQTGVEMEALTACAVAALTVLAALLPTGADAAVEDLGLWEKSGGRSGTWVRP